MAFARVGRRLNERGKRTSTYKVAAFLCCAFLSSLILFARPVSTHQYSSGVIEGTLLDSGGMPVRDATVYVLQAGRTPVSVTDEKGKFLVTNIRAGQHRVFAYKESEGYPNPLWSFYSEASSLSGFPLVTVPQVGTLSGVTVRFGPKASRLRLKVTDAKTKRPISNAAVSMNHENKPKTLLNAGATAGNGELQVLIPANTPVQLRVSGSGYQTYNYRSKTSSNSSGLELQPGENRSLSIELTRN